MNRKQWYDRRTLTLAQSNQHHDTPQRAELRAQGEHCQEWHWCELEANHVNIGLSCRPPIGKIAS